MYMYSVLQSQVCSNHVKIIVLKNAARMELPVTGPVECLR